MKHVLIVDLSLNGHHSSYLEHIASAYLDAGYLVTTTIHHECEDYPVIARLKSKYGKSFRTRILTGKDLRSVIRSFGGNLGSEFANWYLFRKKFFEIDSESKVDYVLMPYLDYCMTAIGLLGSPFGFVQWSGICMQASIHHFKYTFLKSTTKFNFIKRLCFLRLLRNSSLDTFFTIDELLFKFAIERGIDPSKRIQYLGDPAEFRGDHTRASARKVLNIPEEAVVILVYGVVSARKGLDVLVNALSHSDIPKSLRLLIVGEHEGSLDHLFKSVEMNILIRDGRVYIIKKFVDDVMQQMAFAATDIVWLGYVNHFSSSGVLVLAAVARKVVIATNDGLIGWHTREKRLGVTVDVQDIVAVRRALMDLSEESTRLKYQRDIDSVFDEHTWNRATQRILATGVFS